MNIDFFEIDEHKLDEEVLGQAELYAKWALRLAAAREAWERAKAERDVTEAEVSLKVRKTPEAYLECKATEGSIASAVLLQKEMRAAIEVVIKAKYELDQHQGLVDALEQRKKGMEMRVSLMYLGWNAEPRVSGPGRELQDEMIKRRVRSGGRE